MDNFVVERGEFFLWIRLLTSSSSSRHSHNLAMIEKRIEDRSDVTHSTSNAFVHVHVQNTFSYVCLFMKKSFTQQTWLHHSFSVCRSTLLFSVCRTILHLSVCRTILHLSIFVELSTFVGLFLLLFSLSLSIYLTFVCLSRSFFLLCPLNKHSHKSTRMGQQFKITFLTNKVKSTVRSIPLRGMTTPHTHLRCIMSINLYSFTALYICFIFNKALQFSKRP